MLGLPFPRLSDDPLEQWLVHEAIMAAYHEENQAAAQRAREREERLAQGRDMIAAHKQSIGAVE